MFGLIHSLTLHDQLKIDYYYSQYSNLVFSVEDHSVV